MTESLQLERKRLADQIVDRLVVMIEDGQFKPGDKLPPEPQLMRQFGVGRSSVREAIGALSLVGLLTVRPGHGTHVTRGSERSADRPLRLIFLTMGREKVDELVEARIEIEKSVVRMAACKATDEEIAEIRRQHEQLKKGQKTGRRVIQADLRFHQALAQASHNSILKRFLMELRQPMRRWMEQKASLPGGYDQVVAQHAAILESIEKRDPDRAESALKTHLESAGELLTAALMGRNTTERRTDHGHK